MKKIMIYLGSAMMLFASCSDFLDPESKSEYIPDNVSSLNSLLIGYEPLGKSVSSLLELLDDDIACQPVGTSEASGVSGTEMENAFEMFTWQPDYWQRFEMNGRASEQSYNIWSNVYSMILKFNAVLDYIDEVEGTSEMRNWVRGQALALRSYWYHWLVNIFGVPYSADPDGLGIVLKLESAAEPGSMARATVGQAYDRIVSDLLEAERCLENTREMYAYNMNYRMNLPCVRLLLSRVYLYMENWTEAEKYATKVIGDEHCVLTDFNVITFAGTYRYPNFYTYNNPEVMWLGNPNVRPAFRMIKYNVIGNANKDLPVFRASDELVGLYDEDDLRREYYLQAGELTLANGDVYPFYRPYSKFAVTDMGDLRSGDVFYMSLRFVEAYINRAEANAMLHEEGKTDMQTVLDDLETVQATRYRTGTAPALKARTAAELIQLVRDERRREFCFENTRWFDLRRYGMSEIKHEWGSGEFADTWKTYTLTEGDRGYTLPLPQPALDKNAGLEQNLLAPRREN